MQKLHHKLPFLHKYGEILLKDVITFFVLLLTIFIDCVD